MGGPVRNAFEAARLLLEGRTLSSADFAEELPIREPAARKYVDLAIEVLEAHEVRKENGARAVRLKRPRLEPPGRDVAVAACFGSSLAPLFEGTGLGAGMRRAVEYVVRASPNPDRYRFLDRKFFFVKRGGEMALPHRAPELQTLVDAVLKEKEIRLRYEHFAGNVSTERVRPLSIAVYDHQVYFMALRKSEELKLYRFSRAKQIVATGTRFEYPGAAEYDPQSLFRDSFGVWYQPDAEVKRVRVRLTKRWRTYAHAHRWCEGQQVKDEEDGVVVEFRAKLCPELESWVLSFGEDVDVLEPKVLRRRIRDRVKRMAERLGAAG